VRGVRFVYVSYIRSPPGDHRAVLLSGGHRPVGRSLDLLLRTNPMPRRRRLWESDPTQYAARVRARSYATVSLLFPSPVHRRYVYSVLSSSLTPRDRFPFEIRPAEDGGRRRRGGPFSIDTKPDGPRDVCLRKRLRNSDRRTELPIDQSSPAKHARDDRSMDAKVADRMGG